MKGKMEKFQELSVLVWTEQLGCQSSNQRMINRIIKDSMVLAQRQKYRSMEQNRKPRDKSTHLWTPYL